MNGSEGPEPEDSKDKKKWLRILYSMGVMRFNYLNIFVFLLRDNLHHTMAMLKGKNDISVEKSSVQMSPIPLDSPDVSDEFSIEILGDEAEEDEEEQQIVISEHQHNVMSSLALLWKNGKLCDAAIGNGTTKIMVNF